MTSDGYQIDGPGSRSDAISMAEMIDALSRFDGPPGEFLVRLLAVQCRLASASAAAILRQNADGRIEPIAMFPPVEEGSTSPVWLASAAESAAGVVAGGKTAVKPLHNEDDLYGQKAREHLLMIPMRGDRGVRGLAVFHLKTANEASLAASSERLELTSSLLSLYEMRLTLQRRQIDLGRLKSAVEVLAAVNEQDKFAGAAMALCNEVASRWQCERVSLGFLKGRYVHLKALSHTEKFSRKMKLVQDIEASMEECLDQDMEVIHPADSHAVYVSRAAGELSQRHGPTAIVSLPLRKDGEPVAVLTVERPVDKPLSFDDIETLRLTCELCTARILNLHEQDRWFGGRLAFSARKTLAVAVGPKHTWVKLTALLVLAAALFMVFARGTYRADAPFVLEANYRQIIPAPFDGYIKTVEVKPGDRVEAGKTVLGTLDTSELRLQLAKSRAERAGYFKRAAAARRDGNTAKAQIADAEAAKITAEIELIEYRIEKARLIAPISGHVVVGDLQKRIGSPVKTGDTLFEVAPLELLHAELMVPEDQIAEVHEGQEGYLTATGYPNKRIGFTVERITPVAEVIEDQNVFRVRVILKERPDWMRPGMEGLAKIDIGTRHYAWIWTRKFTNWVRMKLWI